MTKPCPHCLLRLLPLIVLFVLVTGAAALADTHTWVGLGDGTSWHDPANWSPAELPMEINIGDGADAVVIDGAWDVVVDTNVIAVNSIKIDGDATLTIASGVTLKTNSLDIVNGGLILEKIDGTGANLEWAKAGRGHLYVEAQGYITGSGLIRPWCSSQGIHFRSQRAADFDMTRITLSLAYGGGLTVGSADLGRNNLPAWNPENYAIGSISIDRRFAFTLGGMRDVNALYCNNLVFGGDALLSASLNIRGLNVYVLNKITWGDGSYTDTPGEVPVATAHVDLERWTSLWDSTAEPGQAFVGQGVGPNDPPVADAGPDQSVIDADGDGFEDVQLDGTGSSDLQGPIAAYDWTANSTPLATGATPVVTLPVGDYLVTLTVTDDVGVTDDDTVVVTVQPRAALFPPTAVAGADQELFDFDDDGVETVGLDGSASSDSDGTIVSWDWTDADGTAVASGAVTVATLPAGVNVVTLTVTDDSGFTGADTTTITIRRTDPPVALLPLTNHQAGISVSLGGANGTDWAVERTFHDEINADQVIYLRSNVAIALAHNARNVTMKRDSRIPHPLGIGGLDGDPATDDAGDIHWKIDRDMQCHGYTTVNTSIPAYAPLYDEPFSFDSLTYDGITPVLGAIGDNGQSWGGRPKSSPNRFAYGQLDRFGNEWHTLTYWDDDAPIYSATGVSPERLGASDGHWVYICVNPVTPIIQLTAAAGEQYYTTPIKTYHVPKTWDQTTYLTPGVEIAFVNLTNHARVQYRVDGGPWQEFRGSSLVAGDLFTASGEHLLELRAGDGAPIGERTVVMSPDYPAPDEQHGYLLWADEDEKQAVVHKLKNIQPFRVSYLTYLNSYYQSSNATYSAIRGDWRDGATMATGSLANAFAAAIDGPASHANLAALAKQRLIRMARLEAVGFEQDINSATPSKDYLNELGQTIQQFADAGAAYDLLASCYRQSDHPAGMTPIEEIRIRDGLAEIAKSILQMRANNNFSIGGGDAHWGHGYELAIGIIAAAMPTYATPYFGVSGGDMTTVNDLAEGGYWWNPFPDQGVTWWAAATDPAVPTLGHPNVRFPLRAEAIITDDGWWTGPNDYQGDGNRYFVGVYPSRLVDLDSGGMANAECRVELVEMSGYEAPFSDRMHVLDNIRRIRGDDARQPSVTNYIRRRLLHGWTPLGWNATLKIYTAGVGRCDSSLLAYNDRYEAASLPSAMTIVGTLLSDLKKYYGYESGTPTMSMEQTRKALYDAYTLAFMWDSTQIAPHQPEPNHAPILKPLLKHVVHPGEALHKDLIVMDPDDDPLTITVTGLPAGATFDPTTRAIDWMPSAADAGVHVATVTVSDGAATVVGHWPMIVKADAPSGPIPGGVSNATATLNGDDITVAWTEPGGVSHTIVWRDGIPAVVLPAGTTSWTDADRPGGTHTRYHLSVLSTVGAESSATVASPGYIFIPFAQGKPGDADGDGDVDLDDFVILKTNFGTPSGATTATGDFDGDGDVDLDDFVILKTNFGS